MNNAQVMLIASVVFPIVAGLLFFERRLAKVESGIEFIKQNCRRCGGLETFGD
jgi:hypothetical protein